MRSPWLVICLFLCGTSVAGYAQDSAATRYGIISTAEDHQLYYEGEIIFPEIRGNNSLSMLSSVPFTNHDIVIVRNNGGSICPAEYYLVRVNATGLTAIGPLGNCSEFLFITPAWGKLILETPPFRSEASQAFRYNPETNKLEKKNTIKDFFKSM